MASRFRISLLTLLILVLFTGAAMGFSQVLFQRQNSPLVRLGQTMHGMSFSPDDKRIYVRDSDETVKLFDNDMQLIENRAFKAEGVGFSSSDESLYYVAVFGRAGMTHILDWKTNAQFTLPGGACSCGVSPMLPGNGAILVTLTHRVNLHGFKLPSTTEIWQTTMEDVIDFDLESPDHTKLFVNHDKGSEILDMATGKRLVKFDGYDARMQVFDATWSPDGTKIATGCADSTVNIWDAVTGKRLFKRKDHKTFVMAAQFSGDGTKVLSVDDADNAIVWDATTGKEIRRYPPRVASSQGRTRVVDKDSITIFHDNGVRRWDMQTGEEQYWSPPVPHTSVLRMTRDLRQAMVYNPDHTLELLERDEGKFSWSRFIPVNVRTRVIQFSVIATVFVLALIWSIRRDWRRNAAKG